MGRSWRASPWPGLVRGCQFTAARFLIAGRLAERVTLRLGGSLLLVAPALARELLAFLHGGRGSRCCLNPSVDYTTPNDMHKCSSTRRTKPASEGNAKQGAIMMP
jgi:hypothetical protein